MCASIDRTSCPACLGRPSDVMFPIGLIALNIQHMPKVFEGVTCSSRALPLRSRAIDLVTGLLAQDLCERRGQLVGCRTVLHGSPATSVR